ncbi:MAG TPA: VOC family protein [Pseudonocardia sp.]|nr:VOC family protein [Pseudonocardia sp.]
MTRVVHFDVPIDDPERAGTFYREAFGFHVEKWGPAAYWTLSTGEEPGPGAEGAMAPRDEVREGVLVYFGVDDIDAAMARVKDAGGTLVGDKAPIPAIGWSARVRDSEGNLVGLFQPDATVAGPDGGAGA